MKFRLTIQFGIVAAAGFLLTACANADTNSQAAKAESTNTNQQFRPQTPTPPIGSPPGKRY